MRVVPTSTADLAFCPRSPNPFHLSVLDDIKDVRDSLASGDLLRPVFFLMVVCSMRAQVSPKMLEAPEQTTTGERREYAFTLCDMRFATAGVFSDGGMLYACAGVA
jgi:hypothetical protein